MPFDPAAFEAAVNGAGASRRPSAPPPPSGGFSSELEAAGRNYIATFGHIAGALGVDSAREWARGQEEKASAAASRSGWTQSYQDVDISRPSTLASYVGHLATQSIPYAGEAIAAAMTLGGTAVASGAARAGLGLAGRQASEAAVRGVARTGAAVVGSYPSSVGTILGAQDEQAGEYNLPSAAALGAGYAGMNALGLEGALARRSLGGAVGSGSRVGRAVGTGLRVGAGESANEVGQQAFEEAGRAVVDPNHSMVGEAAMGRYAESAVGGLALGGTVGGARGAMSRAPEPPPPAPISTDQPTNLLRQPTEEDVRGNSFVQAGEAATTDMPRTMADLVPSTVDDVRDPYAGMRGGLPVSTTPAPDPTLSVVDPLAGMRGEDGSALGGARPGETADLFTGQAGPPREQAPDPATQRQQVREEVNSTLDQLDLFAARPSAAVGTDFSLRQMRQRIGAATGGRQDAFSLQIGVQTARLLGEGKPDQAARFLAAEQERLETGKFKSDTIDYRQRVLIAAERSVADYASRMDDARRQDVAAMAAEGQRRAQPGTVVDVAPKADAADTIAQMREANARPMPAAPAPAAAAPQANTIEDVDATINNEAAERSKSERRKLLQAVLDDPTTINPVGRFTAALKKSGYKSRALTDEEVATIERYEATKAAFVERQEAETPAEQQAEDRSGVEAIEALIPERKPQAAPTPKAEPKRPVLSLNRVKKQELDVPPQAQPEAAPAPDQGTIPAAGQISMFKGSTRGFTKTAVGETRRQLLAEAEQMLASLGGTKSKEILSVAIRAFAKNEVDMSFVRDVNEALRTKKFGLAKALVEPFANAEQQVMEAKVEAAAPTPAQDATTTDQDVQESQVAVPAPAPAVTAPAPTPAVPKEQIKTARRTLSDKVNMASRAGLLTRDETQQALRLVVSEDVQAMQLVQAMLNERVAAKKAGASPSDQTPAAAPGRTMTQEEVRTRLLRDRAAPAAPATTIRTEISAAQTQGRITPAQASNVRETLKEEGETAAREQLQSFIGFNNDMRRPGTARRLELENTNQTAADPNSEAADRPDELNFEGSPRVSPGLPASMSVRELEGIAARRMDGWRNPPTLVVVQSSSDLPARFDVEQRGLTGAFGFYDRGTIYLIADNTPSEAEAVATIYHEAFGHYGLQQAFGQRLEGMLQGIYQTNPAMRRMADAYLRQYPGIYGPAAQTRAVEEVLATAAEQGGELPISVMDRLKAFVAQFARRIGVYNGDFSNAEVIAIVNRAVRAVSGGPSGPRGLAAPSTQPAGTQAAPRTFSLGSMDGLKSIVQERSGILSDLRGTGRRLRIASLFQRNMEELYGKLLPTLRGYNDLLFRMSSKVNTLTSQAHEMLDNWNRLEGGKGMTAEAVQKEVGELALDATYYQIRPDLPLAADVNSQVTSDGDKKRYMEMQARFNALPDPAQKLYTAVFDKFAANLAAKKALFKRQIQDAEGLSAEAKRQSDREIEAFFKRVKVYFPLMRFGQNIVIGRSKAFADAERTVQEAKETLDRLAASGADEATMQAARDTLKQARKDMETTSENEGYTVQAFESEAEAKRVAKQLRESGLDVTERAAHDYQPEVDGVSARFLETIRSTLDAQGRKGGADKATADHLKNLFTQAYFQALPEHHALKRNIKRQNVQGFNRDAKRTFAAAMVRDAHYLARLEFGQTTKEALEKMRNEAREADKTRQDANPDAPKLAQEVYEEVHKRHAASLRYVETPVQDVAANVGYLWFLGFTPSFMVLNTLQTPMVTLPMMAARHGVSKAGAALAEAMRQVGTAQISSFRKDGLFGEIQIDTLNVTPDEKAMLRTLLDSGIIDLTQEHDLGTIAQGGNTKWRTMMRVASWAPHYTEKVNRLSTALAGYRLALQEKQANPSARIDPVQYAAKMVADSHFDYSSENAPRWMRPGSFPLAKVIFQFRKYQLAMGYAVVNNFTQGFLKAKPADMTDAEWREHKQLAKRTFFGLMLTHGAAAGTLGLPGAAMVIVAANAMKDMFGDDDEPWDAEAAYRNFLVDVFGGLTDDPELARKMGEIVSRGAFRAPGVRDVLPGDISQRVGLGDLFSPVRLSKSDNQGRDQWNEIAAAMWGPAGSIIGSMFEATRYFSQGDVAKGVELSLPKAARDIMRSYRFGTEGVTTARGNVVMGADNIPVSEIVAQALGFTPARIMEQYEARSAVEGAKQFLNQRRQSLLRSYSEARLANDSDAVAAARAEIAQFNQTRRANGQPLIKNSDMLRAYQERRNYERDLVNGARLRRSERALGEYGRFAVTD